MTEGEGKERARGIGSICLCFAAQRAARTLARRFDEVFRAKGITNGQFSIMAALSQGRTPANSELATMLGMDRATVSAALKPLQRRGLVEVTHDDVDRRRRRVRLSGDGLALFGELLPIWEAEHAALEEELPLHDGVTPDALRAALRALHGASEG